MCNPIANMRVAISMFSKKYRQDGLSSGGKFRHGKRIVQGKTKIVKLMIRLTLNIAKFVPIILFCNICLMACQNVM